MLRTQFSVHSGTAYQTLLPASAVQLTVGAALVTNGTAVMQQLHSGGLGIRSSSTLAAEWRKATAAPFDLYNDPMVRIKVTITMLHSTYLFFSAALCRWLPCLVSAVHEPARCTPHQGHGRAGGVWATELICVYCCAQLWRVSSREHVLLIVQHHAITDGISLAILGRDLAMAYSAALRGVSPELPLLGVAYIDYAAWQRAQHGGDAFETALAWWRQTLTGAPGLLELPVDRPRPPTRSTAGAQLSFTAPSSVSQGLQQLAAAQQTTAFVVVLAALQVVTLLAILLPFPINLLD